MYEGDKYESSTTTGYLRPFHCPSKEFFFLDKAKWKTLSLKYPNYVINVYTQIVCSILCLNGIAPSFRNKYKSEIEIIISHGFYHSALLWQNHEIDNTV